MQVEEEKKEPNVKQSVNLVGQPNRNVSPRELNEGDHESSNSQDSNNREELIDDDEDNDEDDDYDEGERSVGEWEDIDISAQVSERDGNPEQESIAQKICRPEDELALLSNDVEEVLPFVTQVSREIFPEAKSNAGQPTLFEEKKKQVAPVGSCLLQ